MKLPRKKGRKRRTCLGLRQRSWSLHPETSGKNYMSLDYSCFRKWLSIKLLSPCMVSHGMLNGAFLSLLRTLKCIEPSAVIFMCISLSLFQDLEKTIIRILPGGLKMSLSLIDIIVASRWKCWRPTCQDISANEDYILDFPTVCGQQ